MKECGDWRKLSGGATVEVTGVGRGRGGGGGGGAGVRTPKAVTPALRDRSSRGTWSCVTLTGGEGRGKMKGPLVKPGAMLDNKEGALAVPFDVGGLTCAPPMWSLSLSLSLSLPPPPPHPPGVKAMKRSKGNSSQRRSPWWLNLLALLAALVKLLSTILECGRFGARFSFE